MPVRIIIPKARRTGVSTGVEALIYDNTSWNDRTDSLIVANERNPSENLLRMCHTFWEETPEQIVYAGQTIRIRPQIPAQYNNNMPRDRIEFVEPKSRIFLASARSINAYLGYRFTNVHATEASRYLDGHELFRALYPTILTTEASALYIESTPNGQEGPGAWFYEQVMLAADRKKTEYGDMRLVFIPWHMMKFSFSIPFKSMEARAAFGRALKQAEKDLLRQFPHIELEQLQWRRMMLAGPTFNSDEDIFDQEYPSDLETAFLSTGKSVFTRKTIKRLRASVTPPIWEGDIYWGENDERNLRASTHEAVRAPSFLTREESRERGFGSHVYEGTYRNLRVWRWPRTGDRIFVASDIGRGNPETRDGDWSTAVVGVLNDFDRDEVIMTWRGHINTTSFGELLSALCWGLQGYVGDSVVMPELIPEWTGPGTDTCTYIDKKSLYPHLYRYETPGVRGMPAGKHIGWQSDFKTKPMAVGRMTRRVESDMIDVPDQELVREMSSFRSGVNGYEEEYGGAAGRHDDLVAAFAILCAILSIRSATVSGQSEAIEIDDDGWGSSPSSDDETWDKWAGEELPTMPGVTLRDIDDEGVDAAWGAW